MQVTKQLLHYSKTSCQQLYSKPDNQYMQYVD